MLCGLGGGGRLCTCDEGVGPRLLLSPCGNKHSDVFVSFLPKPLDCKLDTTARENLFVPMAGQKIKGKQHRLRWDPGIETSQRVAIGPFI